MLGLRYFIMLCKNAEYKKMDQDMTQGQLYDVQNKINILYKAQVEPTHLVQLQETIILKVDIISYFLHLHFRFVTSGLDSSSDCSSTTV
jgi:hypothetical protein